jgi:hypothetical protein
MCPAAHLTIEDSGTTSEIAAVMNYTNTTNDDVQSCNIVTIRRDGENQRISTISRLWEPLAYPLFFPHATLGWGVVGSNDEIETGVSRQSDNEDGGST